MRGQLVAHSQPHVLRFDADSVDFDGVLVPSAAPEPTVAAAKCVELNYLPLDLNLYALTSRQFASAGAVTQLVAVADEMSMQLQRRSGIGEVDGKAAAHADRQT